MNRQVAASVGTLVLTAAATFPVSAATTSTTFVAALSSIGESVPTSSATGFATVSFDDVSSSLSVQLSFEGLANNSPFGHIHCCTAVAGTGNGPVALSFERFPALASGAYSASFAPANFAALLAGTAAGTAYVNIHTPGTYGSGEIRGFLAPIPEPQTYALMLAGLGAVAWASRRRSA